MSRMMIVPVGGGQRPLYGRAIVLLLLNVRLFHSSLPNPLSATCSDIDLRFDLSTARPLNPVSNQFNTSHDLSIPSSLQL